MPTKKITVKKSTKVKHPKQDPKELAIKDRKEVGNVVTWFKKKYGKLGFKITQAMVRDARKLVGKSQVKVKDYLTKTHGPQKVDA